MRCHYGHEDFTTLTINYVEKENKLRNICNPMEGTSRHMYEIFWMMKTSLMMSVEWRLKDPIKPKEMDSLMKPYLLGIGECMMCHI